MAEKKEPKGIEFKKVTWGETPPSTIQRIRSVKVEKNQWGELATTETKETKITFEPSKWEDMAAQETVKRKPVEFETGQWESVTGLQSPEIIRQFDGVNEMNPFAIQDGHATRTKNMTTTHYPAIASRRSGADFFTKGQDVQHLMNRGRDLYTVLADGALWMIHANGTEQQLRTGLGYSEDWSSVNFKGNFTASNLLLSNGSTYLRIEAQTVSTWANVPAGAKLVTAHDNRVYAAKDSTLYFSALRKAEDWTTVNDAGQIEVETGDAQNITGLHPGTGRLTVFKKNSIHELYGNGPSNYQLKLITNSVGTVNGKSIQEIDGVLYFLAEDGIYRYSGGSAPEGDFSIPVRETIKKMTPGKVNQGYSWIIGKKYYVSFSDRGAAGNDLTLEYDTEFDTWNIWKFDLFVTSPGIKIDEMTYLGLGSNVVRMDGTGTSDNGLTSIQWEWVSKPFTFQSMAAKSRWYKMWVVADIPSGATFNVYISTKEDGESWTLVKTLSPKTDVQAEEIRIPVNLINHSNWVRIRLAGSQQVVIYEVSRQARVFPMGHS